VSKLGFTLIEVLIVLAIIAVILTFATLSIGDGGQAGQLRQEARRLAALLELASQQAIGQVQELGVAFTQNNYRFYQWQPPTFNFQSGFRSLSSSNWHPLASENTGFFHSLPMGMQLQLSIEGNQVNLEPQCTLCQPQLLILSSGEWTPFNIVLHIQKTIAYQITGDLVGQLTVHPINLDL